MSQHNIVIVGGSFGGLAIAHKLLQKLIPTLNSSGTTYKITMVSAATHFWWTVGAPRAMFKPYPHDNMDSFLPIEPGFTQYPAKSFTFVHGEAMSLDTASRTLTVKLLSSDGTKEASGTTQIKYDSLVLATGAKSVDPLYSYHLTHEPTLRAYEKVQATVPQAKSVIVVGGGAAGTETAGELGSMYGRKKDITILSGADHLLPRLRAAIGKQAQKYLEDMGVKVINKVTVVNTKESPSGGKVLELSDGRTMQADVIITATGRTPVTEWLPDSLLNDRKYVVVDEHLRVPAAGKNVYAIGDITSTSTGGAIDIMNQTPVLLANITHDLKQNGAKEQSFKAVTKDLQIVPVGKSKGVGAIYGIWAPSLMVWGIKGRNFMFPNAKKTVMGTA